MICMKTKTVSREKEIYRVTFIGSIVNLLLLLFKFAAAFIGHSSAMMADAVHSLSDFITDIVVVVFVRISSKPADEGHDYGHGKYETLGTVIIGVALMFVGIMILVNSVESIIMFFKGEKLAAPGWFAFIAAIVSIVSKEILYQYTVIKGRKLSSQAVVANAWHHRSDALSSIGTAVGIGGAILLGEKWRVLDPVAALIVSCFIIKVSVELLKPGFNELLEKSLPADVEDKILEIVNSSEGVSEPHNLRTRRIGNRCAIEMHLRMDGNVSLSEAHDKATEIERKLREEFGKDTYINIHLEPVKKKA